VGLARTFSAGFAPWVRFFRPPGPECEADFGMGVTFQKNHLISRPS